MQFLHPEVFYMLLIPLILLIVLILTNNNNMKQHFSKEIIDKLSVSNGTIGKTSRNVMFFTTIIFFIVALGRPVVNQKDQELKQQLIPIVIALDVSKSMMATDIYPNRISLAKLKLKEIIKLASNSTIGVVLFAKDSFILSPVTEDFISLNYIVDNLDTNLNFNNGSNIYATLEATAHMLEEFKVKNLIILSDGGNNNEYTDELEFVKEKNIEIYSIGLATKDGSPIPNDNGGYITDNNGNIVTVKLNSSIKNLSLKSGGGYIDFSLDNSDVEAIINRINIQSKKEELNSTKIRTYTELFYYPLGFAVFILFLSFISLPTLKNSSNIVVIFVLISLYQDKGYADFFEFKTIEKANRLYQDKNYKDALKEYEKLKPSNQSIYNKANSLYKDGKYKDAEELYNKIDTQDKELNAKKFHNLGNSFVKQNNLQKAKESYEESLKYKEDQQTKENLEMVKKELEKQKEQNQKDKDNKKQQNKDDKKKDDKKKDDKKNKENQEQENKEKKQNNKNEDQKNNDGKKQSTSEQKIKKDELSQMQEKKYMDMLNKQKAPILLRKMESQKGENNNEYQPW